LLKLELLKSRFSVFKKVEENIPFCSVPTSVAVLRFLFSFRGRDRMVVRFTTTCAISAYHH